MVFKAGVFGQTTIEIDNNNAHAYISDHGTFFNNQGSFSAGYEIPAGSGNHTVYMMGLWMGGLDNSDQLHMAVGSSVAGSDLFAGPIANDYNSPFYLANYSDAIWKITKSQIHYHMNNFTATGYVPDPAISEWPGNGNVSEGIAQQLAPYIDVNGDQIYNPMDGDYPYIQGDEAVYVIMNDVAGDHTITGTDSLGFEIHFMFYQFTASDAINNTTFMNVKLYNRSSINYHDFYLGLWMDYDLGEANNYYIGCDSVRNLSYVYNGYDTDNGQGGQPGYGPNTPAFGSVLLNQPLGTFLTYNLSGAMNGDPSVAPDFYYYLKGYWKNGAHILYGGNGFNVGTTTSESNFMYSGNPLNGTGWNEITEGNPPGDKRGVMSTKAMDVAAGTSVCFDYAFIYNRDGNTHLENANELLSTADFVQTYYNDNIQPCNQIFLANHEQSLKQFAVYPNPSNGNFYLELEENALVSVLNLNGQVVSEFNCGEGINEINLNVDNGMYFIQLRTMNKTSFFKIEIMQ